MKIYEVGGAVRDALLGEKVEERDYVVVGSTPEAMLDAGFEVIGKDFPVFLHPKTREEYALARTERNVGAGYTGFTFHASPEIALEEDLLRRDLTINAMARDDDGQIIDPYGGQKDLEAGIFRHVSPAFEEDPVRILRIARFAARFTEFTIADETMVLMKKMVARGDMNELVPERVWQEIARGIMSPLPSRMFYVLRECGALAVILPEFDCLWGIPQPEKYHPEIDTGIHTMAVLDLAASLGYSLRVRFSALCHDLGKGKTPPENWPSHHGHEDLGVPIVDEICDRLRIPNDCREVARLTAQEHSNIGRAWIMRADTVVEVFERCDAMRRPERLFDIVKAAECDYRGRGEPDGIFAQHVYTQKEFWKIAWSAANAIDAGGIAYAHLDNPKEIPAAIRVARIAAVRASTERFAITAS